ncbi:MAG TPA: gliding motility-associated peptidyl-prolyl isomerase GldI [Flavobacteriaceae bacterium]|nr:gliding motility-associated peptidyl-prolyl isomerase GldI [Flavobacteriaceae bacterium]
MKEFLRILMLVLLFAACKSPEPRRPVSQSSGSFIDRSIKHNKKLIAFEENLIKEIIAEDTVHNYLTSQNGFWYYYNKKIDSVAPTPDFGDQVVFEYNILQLDGTPIYSSEEIPTRTYMMDKEDLITGLRQGLKLMKAGETVTFLFPSYNAFGYYGDTNKIGSNVPIKSTVTLKSIKENSEIPLDTLTK